MSARAASAPGAGVLDRLQVLRSAPTPLRGALAATWTPSPRTGVGPLRVPGPGLQPSSHDTTTTRTDPAGSTLARPDFGPKDGVHLKGLSSKLLRRRSNNAFYRKELGRVPGVTFMPEADYGVSNCWLTCILVEPSLFGATREDVRLRLEALDVESRPVWKPMHLQPVFQKCRSVRGDVAEHLFAQGLCLPSGSCLTDTALTRVVEGILSTPRGTIARLGTTNKDA